MSAHKKRNVNINLLPKDPFSESSVGKILEWALSTGRYIVVFSEMVVIMTFLQRFSLDRKISDINERLFSLKPRVESYATLEKTVEELQIKASFIAELENQLDIVQILNYLNANTPTQIRFTRLGVSDTQYNLIGNSYSDAVLETFIEKLQAYDTSADIRLDSLVKQSNSVTSDFRISVVFPNKEAE